MRRVTPFLALLITCALTGCGSKDEPFFKLLPAEKTGLLFVNEIADNDTFNILTHEYIYNGGGVGVADLNHDGLQDIFFAGNTVPNRLYLNRGDLTFEDVTQASGIEDNGKWNSGVAIADVNQDGWMDIYVTATMLPDSIARRNMLYIHKGLGENGVPVFEDMADSYGLADEGYSVTAAFFDYDRDGDLDLYVLTNEHLRNVPTNYRNKITDGSSPNNDRLYRNNGNGSFTNVTKEAGITIEGFGLGLSISDVNLDGWPDIYVSNDFLSNDLLYINNGNGTFTNRIAELMGHQSQFSMGNDAADINNDGMPDIVTVDMLPETNDRKKTTIANKSYLNYINNERFNYEHQYVRNMLHLNNGAAGNIKFSEIGQLAGVHQTEWSWAPLFADFDNDGNKDLVITNGFPKDITDKDFANYRAEVGNIASLGMLEDSIPVVKIPNFIFRNNGDLTFRDMTTEWGFDHASFSNGAAFADLDNDGDLDFVVSNINSEASLYENTLYHRSAGSEEKPNFVRVRLEDPSHKQVSVGARVSIHAGGTAQYYENNLYRGFLSTVEDVVHFGLGKQTVVDSLVITWADGSIQKVENPVINQVLTVAYAPSSSRRAPAPAVFSGAPLLVSAAEALGISFKHQEEDKIDYNVQRTLPHKFTQSGPGLAVGDINMDGLEDFVTGGSTGYVWTIFLQTREGNFRQDSRVFRRDSKKEEDEGLLLFDADGDGDTDLYVVSGSIEHYDSRDPYQDRLYRNNGKGKFVPDPDALPDTRASGSCVRAADFDGDGDLDLFVGGRVVPAAYPTSPESYLLRNDNGKFTDVTMEVCPALRKAGMITDARWTDFTGDGRMDLIAVGEFTAVMFFENNGTSMSRIKTAIDTQTGWWNSITAGDYDADGDTDYVVGNLGLNNSYQVSEEHPLKVFAKDFDGNGSMDAIMACYLRESMTSDARKLYPVHFWDELNAQSPKFRNKFSRYRQYAGATMDDLLTPEERKDALELEARQMASVYIENRGGNDFVMRPLPVMAQVAPVLGLVTDDVDGDGNLDVLMVGNDYGNEVFVGRHDALNGLVLRGDGHGNFSALSVSGSGFYVPGDAKSLVTLRGAKADLFIASQNRDSLKVFMRKAPSDRRLFKPDKEDVKADLIFGDGRKQVVEFCFGSGYLSQSSRTLALPPGVKEIRITRSDGKRRIVVPE